MYGYYREKLQVNHFLEFKGSEEGLQNWVLRFLYPDKGSVFNNIFSGEKNPQAQDVTSINLAVNI